MEDHLSILCNKYLLWAYCVPDVVEGHLFIFPPKYLLSIYNTARGNGDSTFSHLQVFFFTECLLCAGEVEDWLFIHSFLKKKFIAHLLRTRGDKHLPFTCSFSQYIFIEHMLYANDR